MKYARPVVPALLCAASLSAAAAGPPQLYWGDTHLHTSYSVDAYATGNYVTDPDTAFRYARGLPILHPVTREKIRIERPLDFLVVADHAELLQLQVRLDEEDPDLMATPTGKRLAELHKQNKRAVFGEVGKTNQGEGKEMLVDLASDRILGDAWQRQVKFADRQQCSGQVHRAHWLGMVLGAQLEQPASRGLHLGRWRHRAPIPAVQFISQPAAGRPVGLPRQDKPRDGRAVRRHSAQLEHVGRTHVRPRRQRRPAHHRRIRARAHPLGKRDGDRSDQGDIGDRSVDVAE